MGGGVTLWMFLHQELEGAAVGDSMGEGQRAGAKRGVRRGEGEEQPVVRGVRGSQPSNVGSLDFLTAGLGHGPKPGWMTGPSARSSVGRGGGEWDSPLFSA